MKPFITTFILAAAMTTAAQTPQVTGVTAIPNAPEKIEKIVPSPDDVTAVAECIYRYDLLNGDKRSTGAAMLQIAPTVARFIDYTSFATDSLRHSGDTDREELNKFLSRELRNECFIDQTVLQGFPSGKMTVISPVAPNLYTYTETAYPLPWALSEEIDTIAGYECHKATAAYGGRGWTAWYTTEVPVPFGPWKLTGLPGLVVKATSDDGVHSFILTTLRQGSSVIPTSVPRTAIKTSRDKFVKMKNEFEKDPWNNILPESITNITVLDTQGGKPQILINDNPFHPYPDGYVPFELE